MSWKTVDADTFHKFVTERTLEGQLYTISEPPMTVYAPKGEFPKGVIALHKHPMDGPKGTVWDYPGEYCIWED